MKKTILTVIPMGEAYRRQLQEAAGEASVVFVEETALTQEQVDQAEIILGNIPPEMVQRAQKLEWLQLNSAGYDAYAKPEILGAGRILTCCVGAYGQSVAEHMLAMLLAMEKKLPLYRDGQRQHVWEDHGTVLSIADATLLVLGLGNIGNHFARMAHALGARVLGVKRTPGPCPAYVDGIYETKQALSLLPQADAVVSFLPSSRETWGLVDEEWFRRMKPGSFFLNGGRGNTVNAQALCQALREGWIAGAALDVTDPEPLPPDHPLWDAPGLFLTPHVSGGYHLPVTLDRVSEICVENVRRYQAGEPLRNVVVGNGRGNGR